MINKIDDGFYPWLVEASTFDGHFEIPMIEAPTNILVPKNLIPFSKIAYSEKQEEAIHFYEHDVVFRKILQSPEEYIQKFYPFAAVITPDCSLYRDMPLTLQITNTYMNRAVGSFLQEQGIYVIPNIRWGDERSYQDRAYGEKPFAFIGAPKHSIVSISTYGCIRSGDNRKIFHDGLCAMMEYLNPEVVLVHGVMPPEVFNDVLSKAEFHQYADWTTQKRKKVV